MAGNIKGIIVEIGGDTSALQNALKKVNSVTSSLSKELKGINTLLKLDPSNTELVAQKQTVLSEAIETTKTKLEELKKHEQEVANSGVELNEEQQKNYRNLQREIVLTETKLSDLQNQASKWTEASEKLTKFGEGLEKIGDKVSSLGDKLTKTLTTSVTAVVGLGLTYNAQLEKYTTALTTFLGDAEEAERVVEQIKNDAAKTPFDTASLVQANQMLISTGENATDSQEAILALGDAVIATGGGNDELTRMAQNLQQIKNAGKATALDIKQFAYAGIDVYGILADYMGKTTEEVKDMDISYEDLTGALKKASSQGGKYYNAMSDASETLTGQVSQLTSEVKDMVGSLTKSLMPAAKKIIAKVKEWIEKFDNLSDSQKENIVKIGLIVAAAGPLIKILGTVISTTASVSKGIGTLTGAIGLLKNGIGNAEGASANLAKTLKSLWNTATSPVGLAIIGITAVATAIELIKKAQEKLTIEKFEEIGEAATNFYEGIQNAEGYLDEFNNTLFATTERQQELQDEMDEIQEGITEICKTASDERRGYTQEEITQLEEYFEKLRELEKEQIQIEQEKSNAIVQLAKTESEVGEMSLAETEERATQWTATIQQQADETIKIAEQARLDTIALLNSQYSEEERIDNEEYQRKVEQAEQDYQLAVASANKSVADVVEIWGEAYADRIQQENELFDSLQEYAQKQESLEEEHNEKIRQIKDGELWYVTNNAQSINSENETFAFHQKEIWEEMYKNMTDEQTKELGVWLAMLAQTELYGGDISDENQEMVDMILESYEDMPESTREAMKNAMSPMLEEMENSEPVLYSKATGIADGILSRLKNAFDINSPSRETRNIFRYVMKGAELGLDDEEDSLNKQIEDIADRMKVNFSDIVPNMSAIKKSIIDETKTVFTTPSIIINAQDELTPTKINTIIDTVNKRLGSQY